MEIDGELVIRSASFSEVNKEETLIVKPVRSSIRVKLPSCWNVSQHVTDTRTHFFISQSGKTRAPSLAAVRSRSSHDVPQSPRREVTEFTRELWPVLLSPTLNKQLHSSNTKNPSEPAAAWYITVRACRRPTQ